MAENTVVHIGQNSPEYVALSLTRIIAAIEQKKIDTVHYQQKPNTDRKWLLDTYAECLDAVKGERRGAQ